MVTLGLHFWALALVYYLGSPPQVCTHTGAPNRSSVCQTGIHIALESLVSSLLPMRGGGERTDEHYEADDGDAEGDGEEDRAGVVQRAVALVHREGLRGRRGAGAGKLRSGARRV